MMSGSKKERNLSTRSQLSQKSSAHFCLFSKVRSASPPPGNTAVYLNVYDLTPVNGYVYWAGLGIFHSGIEVHGVEYAFGAHDYSISGVFEVEPRQCPGFKFRKSIYMGTTCLDPLQIREFMEIQSVNYNGDTYHLISKNCNHFCEDICKRLTGNLIPKWVNRLARMDRANDLFAAAFADLNIKLSLPEVLFATAFYRSPSRSMQSVMTQMAKLKIVRKEG